jgi:hypothetical protein
MGFDLETVRRRIALTCKDATSARCLHHEGYLYHIRDAREGGTIVTTVRVNKLKNPRRVPRGKTMDGTE